MSKTINGIIAACVCLNALYKVSTAQAVPWEEVKLGGDFRYRHEYLKNEGEDERHRHRIRGRIKMSTKVNDQTDVILRLATGGIGTSSATSTNQTLDDGFSNKDFAVDLFHLNWKPAETWFVSAGKISNPLYSPNKTPLVWDGDVTPEGVAFQYGKPGKDLGFFLNLASFWLDERSTGVDSGLNASQVGATLEGFGDDRVTVGIGFTSYVNIQGQEPFLASAAGNTLNADGEYEHEYQVVEGFGEYKINWQLPMSLGVLYIQNTAVDEDDRGYSASIAFGSTEKVGWSFKYDYMELERDATLSIYTDSDAFDGRTDARSHVLQASFGVVENVTTSVTYFMTEFDLDDPAQFSRGQLDLNLVF